MPRTNGLAALRKGAGASPRVSLPVTTGADELVAAVQALGTAGIRLDDVALRRPTLDDVFLTLTGKATEKPSPDAANAAKKKGKK